MCFILFLLCTKAERRRLFFSREGLDMQEFMNDGVIALDIGGQFMFDAADHRDFLGSVLGTGLERSKVSQSLNASVCNIFGILDTTQIHVDSVC
jgi:RNA-binding protein YlmH